MSELWWHGEVGREAICQELRRDGGKGEPEVSRIVVV